MTNRFASALSAAAVVACAGALVHADQIRRQPGEKAQVPVEISLKAGAESYQAKGQGSCTHAPKASIYGVVSEMWNVQHSEGSRSIQLTLWKPADGADSMFSFSYNGTKNTTISTIKGGSVSGTGTVTMAPAGKGATFTIDAKGRGPSGLAVTGTIKCEAFTPHIAEGGN